MDIQLRPGIPLHEQISSWLRGQIDSGELPPEAQLPSENELCDLFDVSRVTVRRALQTLEADGVIFRRQGLGSFVCDRRLPQGLVRLTDFAQDMARAGLTASSVVLRDATEPAPPGVAERLGLEPGSDVLRLDRLRLGDGEPVAVDRTWLPPTYAKLVAGHDLGTRTLYEVLERDYNIPAISGRYRITAGAADDEVAGRLGLKAGDPVLVIERVTRTLGGRPFYFQRRYYRSDRMAYELELARDPSRIGSGDHDDGMPLRDFEAVVHPPAGRAPSETSSSKPPTL